MKKLLFTVSFLALLTLAYGQKVDLDKFNFTFEYRDLPTHPLNSEYKTYSLSFRTATTVRANYGDAGLENAINLQGWKKISDAKGHITITVSLEDVNITSSKITERVDIQKDKDGKETSRKYYYKAEVVYTWSGSVSVADYQGASVGNAGLGSGSSKTWNSSEYGTYSAAADYYNNNRSSIRDQLVKGEVGEAISHLNTWLNSNYGYPAMKVHEILWILDSKKHPETPAQEKIWLSFKETVATVKPDNISAETKDKFAEIIKYFDEIPSRFTTDDKGDKKLRYASYYNKAKIYLYLDNPEAAIKEAESLIANGYDDGDGKRLKKEAEDLAALLKKNNATNRHFTIDLSTAAPPASN